MQEKKQHFSPIKQRILYFADTLNISKREFYKKISVSRGTLESSTGITEDIMAKFIATYPEVSPEWLVLEIKKNISPKSARHTFATIFLKRTKDMATLREIMGHTDYRETLIYAHVLDESKQSGIKAFDDFM